MYELIQISERNYYLQSPAKIGLIKLNNHEGLKNLGFRMLIPVHDEIIAECPEGNAKKCADLLAQVMSEAAEDILHMPLVVMLRSEEHTSELQSRI